MSRYYSHCLKFIVLLLCMGNAYAEPLYLQLYETAKVSDETLQKTRKQIKEHKEVKVLEDLSVAAFHKRDKQQKMKKQPLCASCHLNLPHRENERSRTFMNMHTQYIACETCHLQPKDTSLEYRWLAYDGADAGHELAPRSTIIAKKKNYDYGKKKQRKIKPKKISLAPQPGARIAPFFNNELALVFKDSDFENKIKRKWKDASEEEKVELKARLHEPLEKEGPACQRCHGKKKPLLDLEALGATAKRIRTIQHNTITRFFARFKNDDERIRISKDLLK